MERWHGSGVGTVFDLNVNGLGARWAPLMALRRLSVCGDTRHQIFCGNSPAGFIAPLPSFAHLAAPSARNAGNFPAASLPAPEAPEAGERRAPEEEREKRARFRDGDEGHRVAAGIVVELLTKFMRRPPVPGCPLARVTGPMPPRIPETSSFSTKYSYAETATSFSCP